MGFSRGRSRVEGSAGIGRVGRGAGGAYTGSRRFVFPGMSYGRLIL